MAVLVPLLLLTQWLAALHGIWHQADGRMGPAPSVVVGEARVHAASHPHRHAHAHGRTQAVGPHSLASLVAGHEAGSLTCVALDQLCHVAPLDVPLLSLPGAVPAALIALPALPVRPQAAAAAFQARAPPRLA